ncbi:MAG: flavodoxin [Victivallaceae bacterium]|nr:flavodoxin [Victivallaceae bacterium]
MDDVKVIYGSTTGETENVARQIAAAFGTEPVNIANATAADFRAALLILGSSTWGFGELQDDWVNGLELLTAADLTGRKVAVFGFGDQNGFADTYCDAMGILAARARAGGAEIVGRTSTDGYTHANSAAEADGTFCGLALDQTNDAERTADRVADWIDELKSIAPQLQDKTI